ncbi:MAG: tetratricopeptide repeat protein, partial [Candidatus Sumerlaeia bacterium]|nr:tetratricopeptide repeat protein [Candidatus Sumerlaeia bacterium]
MYQNDFVNALMICEEALKDFPDNVELHNHRINILLNLNRIDEAVGGYLTLAQIHKQVGEIESVARCFEKILEFQPDNINARRELVEIYLGLGLVSSALSQIQILIKMYYDCEEFESAEKYCYRVLELDATNYAIREMLAVILQKQNKFFEAIKEYLNLAEMLTQIGEWQRAKEIYKKVLQIDPENLTALIKLRPILIKLNDTKAFVEVSNQLLQLYETQGAISEAIEIAEEISRSEPENLELKRKLAKYYEQNDQIESAVNIYEKLADTYLKQKNIDQA